MKAVIFGLLMVSTAAVWAEDTRTLVQLPAPAQETLRQEMRDNTIALNEVLSLMAAGKTEAAGELADRKLGIASMGKHRGSAFDAMPGPNMPPAMHRIGMEGHQAVSEFASAARIGDRKRALELLPNLTAACVTCHNSYRIR